MDEKTTNKRKAREPLVGAMIEVDYKPSSFFSFLFKLAFCMFGLFVGECKIMKWWSCVMCYSMHCGCCALKIVDFVIAFFIQFDDGRGFYFSKVAICHLTIMTMTRLLFW